MTSLAERPFFEVAGQMRRGEVSPVEYTGEVLQRIDALNPRLHAFIQVSAEPALAAARQAESEIRAGIHKGPLHGVPYALKDLIDYEGLPTTANSRVLENHVAHRDAHVTHQLKKAGAIYIGKLVTNEFACGGSPTDALHPAPMNPWNADYITAGSSSGSAVAVAASLVPLALGTDTNGSIRNPASRCGIVGMKPTYGRVSRRGILPLAPSIDHVGPMTRTIRENVLSLQALAGFDAGDPTSRDIEVPDYMANLEAGVKGLRIGIVSNVFRTDPHTDPAHCVTFDRCLDAFSEGGAQLTELPLPGLEQFNAVARALLSMEGFALHENWLNAVPHLYGTGAKSRLLQGAFFSAADYQYAQRVRGKLIRELASITNDVDIIVTASAYNSTPRIDDKQAAKERHLYQMHMLFNVSGQPALVMPTGISSTNGMPLSIQLAGHAFEEEKIYRAARFLEQALESDTLTPGMINV